MVSDCSVLAGVIDHDSDSEPAVDCCVVCDVQKYSISTVCMGTKNCFVKSDKMLIFILTSVKSNSLYCTGVHVEKRKC